MNVQYKDASNLNARIRLQRFSTNPYGWMRWIFDRFHLSSKSRILELGCGTGNLCIDNAHRVPDGWDVTLSDFSPGMLQEAQQNLGELRARFSFRVIDAQSIPFDENSFDAVIAILVMHHVPDVDRAFSEIHRVLKPGGRFYVGATGKSHMRELDELMARVNVAYRPRSFETFSLDDGAGRLLGWFREATVHRYEDSLLVTEIQPLLDYVLSLTSRPMGERWSEFVRLVESEIRSNGSIRITKDVGVIEAVKSGRP